MEKSHKAEKLDGIPHYLCHIGMLHIRMVFIVEHVGNIAAMTSCFSLLPRLSENSNIMEIISGKIATWSFQSLNFYHDNCHYDVLWRTIVTVEKVVTTLGRQLSNVTMVRLWKAISSPWFYRNTCFGMYINSSKECRLWMIDMVRFWKGIPWDLSLNVNHQNNFRLQQPVPVTLQYSTFEKPLRQSVRKVVTDETFTTHWKTFVKVTSTTASHQMWMGYSSFGKELQIMFFSPVCV